MFICYPTIYDMTMLALVSYMNILIEWKYPVYPDSILKCNKVLKGNSIVNGQHFYHLYSSSNQIHKIALQSQMFNITTVQHYIQHYSILMNMYVYVLCLIRFSKFHFEHLLFLLCFFLLLLFQLFLFHGYRFPVLIYSFEMLTCYT
jgi:hypothetical protein